MKNRFYKFFNYDSKKESKNIEYREIDENDKFNKRFKIEVEEEKDFLYNMKSKMEAIKKDREKVLHLSKDLDPVQQEKLRETYYKEVKSFEAELENYKNKMDDLKNKS